MKHISSSIALALSSIVMVGCGGSGQTPLEFASTAPTTAVVGEEYRYDIKVTPISARDYEITAEGLPDWLELKTEEALPINFGAFRGSIPYMVADGEDIYFADQTAGDQAILKLRIDSNSTPQHITGFSTLEKIGGLAIHERKLYVATQNTFLSGNSVIFYRIDLATATPIAQAVATTPGKVVSLAVADGRLHWNDGTGAGNSIALSALGSSNPFIKRDFYGQTAVTGAMGFDALGRGVMDIGVVPVYTPFSGTIAPLYAAAGCLTGIAGNPGSGTYFASTNCHVDGEFRAGHLRYVPLDWPDTPASGTGTPVKHVGEILDGEATAVAVTASGRVVWASAAEQSLRTFTLQQNTLVGTPTTPGTHEITLTLPSNKTQTFTITVTAPRQLMRSKVW